MRKNTKRKTEWVEILRNEVEKQFDPAQVDGFEDSAPSIKMGILADMYDAEPAGMELSKELAYADLADEYGTAGAWN